MITSTHLSFFNTLTGRKEPFRSIKPGEALMYTCGPTVYDFAHIGNFRAYVFEDLLRRVLKQHDYRVTQVMNLTDVDDKTIAGAAQRGISLNDFTAPYIQAFYDDLDALGIERAERYPRATEHVEEMIALITRLLANGMAYARDGSVYFRVKSFPSYGKLSKKKLEENIAGARVEQDEYAKDEACDFALWKKTEADEPSWPAPFGRGRPGWDIECSAMSMKWLGESFDLHTGGEDNIFPHHENEIAQSEGATGKLFAHYWLHCRFLLVNNEKMSKSKGNFYTVRDLLNKGNDPKALRYLLLSHHYRQPLNFTLESLEAADRTVKRIRDFAARLLEIPGAEGSEAKLLHHTQRARHSFRAALADDLNTPQALGVFFEWMSACNAAMGKYALPQNVRREAGEFLSEWNEIFAILVEKEQPAPASVEQLAQARETARRERNFKKADELRDAIHKEGYAVEDTPHGQRLRKI